MNESRNIGHRELAKPWQLSWRFQYPRLKGGRSPSNSAQGLHRTVNC
jgi:hypothetical protein